jgi:hypothetical protein
MQVEGKSNMSFTLVVGLASVGACMLGACVTALAFTLGKKPRQDTFNQLNVNDGEDAPVFE